MTQRDNAEEDRKQSQRLRDDQRKLREMLASGRRPDDCGLDRAPGVTERREVEPTLRASEERFRAFVTTISDVVYSMSPDWAEMRELIGRNFIADTVEPDRTWVERYLPPDDQHWVLAAVREAIRTRSTFELEHPVIRVDGSTGWILSRAVPMLDDDGEVVEWFGIASDVTRRKQSEEALRRTQAESRRQRRLYETIISSTPDLVYVFDLEYRFTFANDALLQMWGRTLEQSIGKTLLEVGYERWHAEMHEREIDQVVATKQPVRGEVAFPHATLGKRTYDYIFVPVLNADNQVEAVVGTTRDVTERKQAEQALHESDQRLRELNRSLEERVDERTVALERQAERLRSLTAELASAEQRERKRLAAMLHDDLQQSVVAAQMRLEQSRGHVESDSVADAIAGTERFLKEIMDTSRNLTRQLRPPILYEDGLLSALKGLAADIEERYRLHVAIEGTDVRATAGDDLDAMLFDCIRELLTNTAKHAGVEHARIAIRHGGDCLRLVIRDGGRGFDPEIVEKGGHRSGGFGLFSIRERLAALGGDLRIESAPGSGTRIELEAPATSAEDGACSQAKGASEARRNDANAGMQTHVLVVDDHTIVRQGIAHLLNEHEQLVVIGEAGDGAEAIEMLHQLQPDVVLVDVNMPRMNGIETTREIRRQWPRIVTVGLSVHEEEPTAELMLEAGAAAFVPKTGNAGEIVSAILDSVASREARQDAEATTAARSP